MKTSKTVTITREINRCWHECLYFAVTIDGLSCKHDYWLDGKFGDSLLDREEIMNNPYPKSCPLFHE